MTVKIDTDARIAKIRMQEQSGDPANPGAGFGWVYEKNDQNLYFENQSGTISALNYLTQTNLGYTSVGATSDTLSATKIVAKPVTPTTTRPIRGIIIRYAGNATNPLQPHCSIYDDNSGAPGKLIAWGGMTPITSYGITSSSTARWLHMPIYYIPVAGTQIWIAAGFFVANANACILYYDAGGGDYSISATIIAEGGFSTTSGRRYSLYAVQE